MSIALLLTCLLALADPPAPAPGAATRASPAASPAADSPGAPAGDAAPPAARIREVVVFPKHAEITRELVVQALAGSNRAVFADLLPSMNPHTLRASAGSGARITGTELRTAFLEESLSEEIAALDRAVQALKDEEIAQRRSLARLGEQAAFHRAIKERVAGDVERGFTEGRVAVDDWRAVLDFVDAGLADADERRAALELRLREINASLAARSAEREAYSQHQPKETKRVEVAFDAPRAGPVTVRLHTMVDTAVWKPSYDVHLDRATGEVEITGYGQVVQWSGETWDDVRLTLAMSRPDAELALPDLDPMVASLDAQEMKQLAHEVAFVSRSGRDQVESWSQGRFKRRQDRETFRRNLEQLARHSTQTLEQYGLSHAIVEGALSRLTDRFSGVRYAIDRPATVPFDSSPHKVVTFSARVPAELTWVATPALGNAVMLQADVRNTTGQPILEGGASLFLDDSYVGVSSVDGAAQNEGLSFGFGPDDGLTVDRRLVSRTVKGPEAFRQSQVITYVYEITVENFHEREVAVEIADQIPISKTAEIQVSFLQSTIPPAIDSTTGVLRWQLAVDASARQTLSYGFSVECPVGRDVHWN